MISESPLRPRRVLSRRQQHPHAGAHLHLPPRALGENTLTKKSLLYFSARLLRLDRDLRQAGAVGDPAYSATPPPNDPSLEG